MLAELIIPIETLRGQLKKDGYYFRMYKGKQIVQRSCQDSERAGESRAIRREIQEVPKTQNDPKIDADCQSA